MKSLDHQFINYLSPRLDKFSWERANLAKFRCPLCGDSQKSKTKRRGHFYYDSTIDSYRFKCHNCNEQSGWSFDTWLAKFDPTLHEEYLFEKFKMEGERRKPIKAFIAARKEVPPLPKEEPNATTQPPAQKVLDESHLTGMQRLDTLSVDHMAVQYVLDRKIPEFFLSRMYFTHHFRDTLLTFETDAEKQRLIPNDARLVMPFWDETGRMKVVQGRAFDSDAFLRYATVKPNEHDTKVFGEERVNRERMVLVVEGPIDSMFLPNCLASADADLLSVKGDIYIPDNQYRNREVCRIIEKIINSGVKVVLFPPNIPWKDINDMVKDGGMTPADIMKMMAKNVFQGLAASLRFADLRKV
ncbi:DNA primase [Serratia phage vB_SmaA_3M]|uniref:Putative DNA primase subunit n=1 Tax=Serratia phage vB_SmaA_3M TaxID=2419930 RepID=A0A3G2YS96_9CAUD|nr:DNA primase [Serratia phage vB_SmaA_3M]AYP28382.1 putative DNA primase subunit [Serratia phage vB_SmaA_3M]